MLFFSLRRRGEGGLYSISCMAVRSRMTIDPRIPTMPGRGGRGQELLPKGLAGLIDGLQK